MSKILEMIEKRNQAWEGAKAFVESKRDKDGLLSTEDAAAYAAMEQKVKDYGADIRALTPLWTSLPVKNACRASTFCIRWALTLSDCLPRTTPSKPAYIRRFRHRLTSKPLPSS